MAVTIDELSVKINSDAENAASGINGVIVTLNALKTSLGPATEALNRFNAALSKTGRSGSATANVGKTVKNATKGLQGMSSALKVTTDGMKSAFSGISKSMKFFKDQLDLSNSGIVRLGSSILRLAKMRLLRTLVKNVFAGAKEGLTNLALASKEVNANMTKLSSVLATLKNAAGSAIYTALEPWVDTLVAIGNAAVKAFNYISMLFAILAGKSYYKAAVGITETFAEAKDNTKDATDAVKKYKQELMGFDEINSLHPDDDGGSGSGGTGKNKTTPDYEGMFKNVPVENWLKNMVDTADFSGLGKSIANKINNALSNLNWNSIKEKSSKIVDSLTTLYTPY